MIFDYMNCGSGVWAEDGMQPTCDAWGTVLAASDSTGKGNVRVKVRTMKDNRDTFDSVPVLTGYGGSDYGAFFLPEEGDIVRLTFVGGDYRHPVVTGCRFPESSQLVQDSAKKENTDKVWKVKSGSRVAFSGEKGKDKIEISGSKSMKLQLDEEKERISFGDSEEKNEVALDKKNGEVQITAEKTIKLQCGKSSLELKKDGTVTLHCSRLTLEADNVQIKGKSKLDLEGQQLAVNGTTGVSIAGKGQVKVEGKGVLKLSGAMIQLN